ncbi:MAG: carboxypeptidase regulatory-like domain-containing protein [bacterium]
MNLSRWNGDQARQACMIAPATSSSSTLIIGVIIASLCSALNFSVAQERTGHLRGRVELKQPVMDDSRIISKDISGVYQKTATLAPSSYEPPSFVVYIENAPFTRRGQLLEKTVQSSQDSSAGKGALARPRFVIDQRDLTFMPHVLPILVGSTVEFPNSDPVYHNVFSFSKTKIFDLGRYPTGRTKAVTFNKPGLVKVYCDMHSQMNAFILVLANPYFTLTDEQGNYWIRDVPAGTYKVKAWFARLPEKTAAITIRAGENATLDFEFP